jgi:hypothetical protein
VHGLGPFLEVGGEAKVPLARRLSQGALGSELLARRLPMQIMNTRIHPNPPFRA